jgi:hypothetical protein
MEYVVHQEERLGADTQKRRLDEAGEAEGLGNDGEYVESSKRPCTAYGLQSQSQYGNFVALQVDHNFTDTEWVEPPPASSSSKGPIDLVAQHASNSLQILATGAETMLDMGKSNQLHLQQFGNNLTST